MRAPVVVVGGPTADRGLLRIQQGEVLARLVRLAMRHINGKEPVAPLRELLSLKSCPPYHASGALRGRQLT
jgi:hypothetical protein